MWIQILALALASQLGDGGDVLWPSGHVHGCSGGHPSSANPAMWPWSYDFPLLSLCTPSLKWGQLCICLIGSLHVKCLAQCLACSKCSLNASSMANGNIGIIIVCG